MTPARPDAPAHPLRHLIGIDALSDEDIHGVLSRAAHHAERLRANAPAERTLAGRLQINLFFEDSTRTNCSFEIAGKKLGMDVVSVPVSASSVHKGETLIDTAQTLAAMGADVMVVRHKEGGVHRALAERLPCSIVNAGDGTHEHPSQALLDAATVRDACGPIKGLTIAICGDIRHSRVAGSDARLFARLGAKVRFVGPPDLMPPADQFPDVPRFETLKDGIAGCQVVMALRMQFERMEGESRTAVQDYAARGYFETFGLTHQTIEWAAPDARVMHPGPMNRGVEIDGALADDPERSLVLSQVSFGVATRMAILETLLNAQTRG